MTKARQSILDLLLQVKEPISASDLAKQMEYACDPATVYRNLHYLEDHDLATSFILHCSEHGTERYYCAQEGVHHHWFHCEKCHCFIDIGSCLYEEQLKRFEEEHDFIIHDHTFFLTGICHACKQTSLH